MISPTYLSPPTVSAPAATFRVRVAGGDLWGVAAKAPTEPADETHAKRLTASRCPQSRPFDGTRFAAAPPNSSHLHSLRTNQTTPPQKAQLSSDFGTAKRFSFRKPPQACGLRLICLASQTDGFALLADYIPNRQNPNNKCLKTYETYVNIVETKQIG